MTDIPDDSGDLEWLQRCWPELSDGQRQGIRDQLITSGDRGWLARCRKTVGRTEVDTIGAWLDTQFSLIAFVPDTRYLPMVRVHLECAHIAARLIRHLPVPDLAVTAAIVSAAARAAKELGNAWNRTGEPVGDWNGAALAEALISRRWTDEAANEPTAWSDALFECLRPGLLNPDRISLAFLKDLTREMLTPPSSRDAAVPRPSLMPDKPPPLSSSVAPALFTRSGVGEAGTLTMELLPGGQGEFYPATDMAFVLRKVGSADKPDFRESEIIAPRAALDAWGEMIVQHAGPEPIAIRQRWSTHAIRWRLSVPNGVIRELEGPSLGALFALHIGQLLAR
jgi:hypothetical protein